MTILFFIGQQYFINAIKLRLFTILLIYLGDYDKLWKIIAIFVT